ncbi:hypothetical protein SAMN03159495_3362 [Pseudomonas sp. NFR16]|nr:hypothetical protein SAMN03159495_3362 [Pseudomonas sp. NFR16]
MQPRMRCAWHAAFSGFLAAVQDIGNTLGAWSFHCPIRLPLTEMKPLGKAEITLCYLVIFINTPHKVSFYIYEKR